MALLSFVLAFASDLWSSGPCCLLTQLSAFLRQQGQHRTTFHPKLFLNCSLKELENLRPVWLKHREHRGHRGIMMKRAFIKRCQGTSQIGCAMKTMALALCAEALRRMVLAIVSSCNLHNSSSISVTSVFSVVKKSTSQ